MVHASEQLACTEVVILFVISNRELLWPNRLAYRVHLKSLGPSVVSKLMLLIGAHCNDRSFHVSKITEG